MTTKTTINQHL